MSSSTNVERKKCHYFTMALKAIRLRTIIKRISILSAVEIDLSKTKEAIENNLEEKETERRILDEKIENKQITGEEWDLRTDVVDYIIAENSIVINELETKISSLESERYKLQAELSNYEHADIERVINALGIWNEN